LTSDCGRPACSLLNNSGSLPQFSRR
jgi:hypothetical protein